jgi:hypothetical protein
MGTTVNGRRLDLANERGVGRGVTTRPWRSRINPTAGPQERGAAWHGGINKVGPPETGSKSKTPRWVGREVRRHSEILSRDTERPAKCFFFFKEQS